MKKITFLLALSLGVLSSCNESSLEVQEPDTNDNGQLSGSIDEVSVEGVVRIKFSQELLQSFDPVSTRNGGSTGIPELDEKAKVLGVKSMTRTFPPAGKFEKRQQEAGLHLWYDVVYDRSNTTTRALTTLDDIQGIDIVEPIYEVVSLESDQKPVVFTREMMKQIKQQYGNEGNTVNSYFDDEFLAAQWHYNNEGLPLHYRQGADVNAFAAWDIETGRPEVIVGVVDGGIQFDHPDLAQNMWVNQAELNGEDGVDDDDNGYVDDVYGYNFVTNSGQINAQAHGTHVAGTIGAVNNNGEGVAGIAGGNGDAASGVRLMSCQIFDSNGGASGAPAIVYSCNNGAVISQNSWGYLWQGEDQEISAADRAAIDYFTDYAGLDENGNQVGPMKGGIVIFGSGNDNTSGLSMPGAYAKTLAVAATAPDYGKAIYSNYGNWMDISAPGGDGQISGQPSMILSTLPGNGYGYMEGTSMACPHVSGVAALAISKFGKAGFTAQDLEQKLLAGVNDIEKFNPDYVGQLGSGTINAQKVLAEVGTYAPDRVYDLMGTVLTYERATLEWSIPADKDNGKPTHFILAWNKSPLWNVKLNALPEGTQTQQINVDDKKVGDKLSATVTGLEVDNDYYFAVIAVDADGNQSPSTTIRGYASENRPPYVEKIPVIKLKKTETLTVALTIGEYEQQNWTYTPLEVAGINHQRKGEQIVLEFNGLLLDEGSQVYTIELKDELGVAQKVEIPYTVLVNHNPELIQQFKPIVFYDKGSTQELLLASYFKDVDKDELTYEFEAANPDLATYQVSSGLLQITANQFGSTEVTVTALDAAKGSVSTQFQVICRNPEQAINIYPSPVQKDGIFHVRMGADVNGYITVTLHNAAGSRVFEKEVLIAPQNPARVNISQIDAGNYKVTVRYINQKYTQTITKL